MRAARDAQGEQGRQGHAPRMQGPGAAGRSTGWHESMQEEEC
ncbi:hypothetical protein P355_3015 [Burkholderia cenocepacia KC-01]|nr:hypothetical protein P355_3015 [Burkholderia cenocepacia KC-01]